MSRPNWLELDDKAADETTNIVKCCYALLGLDIKDVEHLGRSNEPTQLLINTLNFKANNSHHLAGINATNGEFTHLVGERNRHEKKNQLLQSKIDKNKKVFEAMKQAANTGDIQGLKNNTDQTLYPKQILIAGIDALREKISPETPITEESANDLDKSLTALQQCADVTLYNTKIDSSKPNTNWKTIQAGLLAASKSKTKKTSEKSTRTEHTGEVLDTEIKSIDRKKPIVNARVPYFNAFPDKALTGKLHQAYDNFTSQYANLPETLKTKSAMSQSDSLFLNHTSAKSGHPITTQTSYHDQSRTIVSEVINPEGLGLQEQLEANIFSAYAYLASNSVTKELPNSLFLNLATSVVNVQDHKSDLDKALSSALSKLVDDGKQKNFTVLINGSSEEIKITGSRKKKPSLKSTVDKSSGLGVTGNGENGGSNQFFSNKLEKKPEIQVNQANNNFEKPINRRYSF